MFLNRAARHRPRFARAGRYRGLQGLALIGLIFALGVAVGVHLPWSGVPSFATVIAATGTASAPRGAGGAIWTRGGNEEARHPVEVIRVLDGDTFEARVHVWPGLEMVTRVRLRGIDAPELRAACPQELRMAREAQAALRAMLAERGIAIFNIGPDKYSGRIVADAATRQTPDVSAALLAAGHVRGYFGGRRSGWCDSVSR